MITTNIRHAKWGAMRSKLTGIVQQGIAEIASQHTQVRMSDEAHL
jgi:hypothetical protein